MITKYCLYITDNTTKEMYGCFCYFSDILEAFQFIQGLREEDKTVSCMYNISDSSYPKEMDRQVTYF